MLPVARAPALERERRIDYVDGLRAVAVLGVIVFHVASHSGFGGPMALIASEGARGVDLFFVLSGFCLAFPTLSKLRQNGVNTSFDIVAFAAKRIVRIVPPFYLATALFVALLIVLPAARHPGRPLPWTFNDIVAPLLFLDGHATLLNSSFWTLMVEFRWYFAFPLLLALWIRSPRAFIVVGASSAIAYHFTRARGLDLGTLPGFMLGIAAADMYVRPLSLSRWGSYLRRYALLLALVCAAIGIACEPSATIPGRVDEAGVQYAYQPTILGWQLAMFFLVVASGELAALRRLLSLRAVTTVGIASYGIYLVHEPVVDTVVHWIGGPIAPFCAFAAALGTGFAFWAVAERPFTEGPVRIALVQYLTRRIASVFAVLGITASIRMNEVPRTAGELERDVPAPAVALAVDLP